MLLNESTLDLEEITEKSWPRTYFFFMLVFCFPVFLFCHSCIFYFCLNLTEFVLFISADHDNLYCVPLLVYRTCKWVRYWTKFSPWFKGFNVIYRKPYTSSQNGLSHTLKRKFSPIVGRLEKISSQNLPSNRERQYNLGLALFYHKEIKICLVGFRKSFNHRFSVSKDLSLFPPHWGTH